jgi:hypothetical protein
MPLFLPNASRVDVAGGGTIAGTPVLADGSLWQNVDEGFRIKDQFSTLAPPSPNDANYVTFSGLGAGKKLWLKFAIPNYYLSKTYGDGLSMQEAVSLRNLRVRIRARNATSLSIAILASRDAGSTTGQIGSDQPLTPTFAWYTFDAATDPLTSTHWRSEDLGTPLEIALSVTASSATDLSVFHIETTEAFGTGNVRTRIGPKLGEPSMFCAICGVPRHMRQLVRVEDPDHPHSGWWLCPEDLDDYDRPEEEEPVIVDGDIDFDL